MSDGKFGGPPMGRSADDSSYGFFAGRGGGPTSSFGGPAAAAGSSSFAGPSTFGAGAPSAPSTFGAPTYGPSGASPFSAPTTVPYSGGSSSGSKRGLVALVVLAVVVVVGGFGGFRYYQHNRGITVPTTLGGLAPSTDTRVTSVLTTIKKSVQASNKDFNLDAAVYGSGKNIAFLLIGRGDVNVTDELAAFKGATQQVGANTCLVQADKSAVGCLRTGGQLTVIVFTANIKGDLTRASGMVDEAWGQQ
jgi:hypothetical protein